MDREKNLKSKVFKHQQWTLLFLIISIIPFSLILPLDLFRSGEFLGVPTLSWSIISIFIVIGHHTYVMICWRLEIHYSTISRIFKSKAFLIYEIGFFILFFGRIGLNFVLSISNMGTLPIDLWIRLIIVVIISVPMLFTLYSVARYFGMHRAAGADHFLPEYREMEFVKKGIYKYSSNSMYKYAMLVLWVPALLFGSVSGIVLALFNHIYVWVHYYTLEKPDFKLIYGS